MRRYFNEIALCESRDVYGGGPLFVVFRNPYDIIGWRGKFKWNHGPGCIIMNILHNVF